MISLHPTQPSHADDITALLDRSFGPGFRARTAERLREANTPITALSYIARDDQEALVGSINYWPVHLGAAAGRLPGRSGNPKSSSRAIARTGLYFIDGSRLCGSVMMAPEDNGEE